MASVMEIKRALERKAGEFEANKETIADRIKEGIKTAREKLNRVEKELLRGLEISFGPNLYAEQLAELTRANPSLWTVLLAWQRRLCLLSTAP